MPTKLNKAGNQQNYVPAGNGDASGEYGDNASGSNKHFTNFAKPIDEQPKETHIEVDINENDGNMNDDLYNNFNDFIDKNGNKNNSDFNKSLKDLYKVGQQEGKEIIDKVIKNGEIYYRESNNDCCSLLGGSVELSPTSYGKGFDSDSYVKGEIFYHETGHAIDGNYRQRGDKIEQDKYGRFVFNYSASETFVTSTGKTLCDTLKGRQNPPIRERIREAQKDLEEYKLKWYKENKPELANKVEQLLNFDKEVEAQEDYKKNQAIIDELSAKNRLSSFEKNKLYYAKVEIDSIKRNYKYEEKKKIREELRVSDYEFSNEKNKVFGDISDMFCMQGYGYVFGMGHSSSYAKKNTNSRGHEFFAECFSAENTNPESLKLIKKYFPDGYKAYREIIDAIKSGKLKTRKEQRGY